MYNEFEAASFLFNGNEEKAKVFLELLKKSSEPDFKVKMDFSEPSCKWCDGGECWYFMPDSRLRCEYNKNECYFYEENN